MDCSQCSNYTNLEFISTKQLQSERQTTSMFLGAHYYTFERQYKHADFTAAWWSVTKWNNDKSCVFWNFVVSLNIIQNFS